MLWLFRLRKRGGSDGIVRTLAPRNPPLRCSVNRKPRATTGKTACRIAALKFSAQHRDRVENRGIKKAVGLQDKSAALRGDRRRACQRAFKLCRSARKIGIGLRQVQPMEVTAEHGRTGPGDATGSSPWRCARRIPIHAACDRHGNVADPA